MLHVTAAVPGFEHLKANAGEDEQLSEVGELVRDARGGRSASCRAVFHPKHQVYIHYSVNFTQFIRFIEMLNSPNAPGGQAVEAIIVGGTEGGHDVVHLLAVRLQGLPLRHQVWVLPNLVQPEQFTDYFLQPQLLII